MVSKKEEGEGRGMRSEGGTTRSYAVLDDDDDDPQPDYETHRAAPTIAPTAEDSHAATSHRAEKVPRANGRGTVNGNGRDETRRDEDVWR
ncbi:hypothetical protein AB1N83_014108 [Pleurotus pulmonarius]